MRPEIPQKDLLVLLTLFEIFVIAVLAVVIIILEAFRDAVREDTIQSTLLSSLISASSIFAGLLATYLISKVIAIRSERIARLPEIDHLSKKLTAFRKVLSHFDSDFLVNITQVKGLLREKPEYSWDRITDSLGYTADPVQQAFWDDPLAVDTALYLSIEQIVDEGRDELGWIFSKRDDISRRYTLGELIDAYYISNELWTFFDNHWFTYNMHRRVNFKCHSLTSSSWRSHIVANALKIDPKYGQMDIDRHFLSSLGTEFYSVHLPRLISLVRLNQSPMPGYFVQLVMNLLLIIAGGVLFPLLLQLLNLPTVWLVVGGAISVSIVVVSFIFTSIALIQAIRQETDVSDF